MAAKRPYRHHKGAPTWRTTVWLTLSDVEWCYSKYGGISEAFHRLIAEAKVKELPPEEARPVTSPALAARIAKLDRDTAGEPDPEEEIVI